MKDKIVVVNGRTRVVTSKTLSYEDVVRLAFDTPRSQLLTMTFRRGPRKNPEGSLTPGGSTLVEAGMIFDVADTSRA